ncbi:2-keto-4-pentenoate hydratase [Sphingomonas sp. NFR04]|uniref:2-keto-4-pentenoate hydratase n=1 Tax=Sphingomonas sp. NFR04 TaxID=1566283 RepID=UPI0008E9AB01|nr:2-keto-4-pentenoate hydratase [Sphingomonas sp. NFR04]SFJ65843.1 2-keto-4-pentenoate hydratase [Sphingomonas sp. NFR04]
MEPNSYTSQIARAFVEARRTASPLAAFPGATPADLPAAYAVQDAALALVPTPVAGWKVGRINPPVGGVDRLAGPIFADQVQTQDGIAMPIFAGGFGAAEAEFLLRIGRAPDPAQRRFSMAEARALIDAVHVGIEIASSPFAGINDHGPMVTISDFGNNNGLVVGAPIDDWREIDLNRWPVALNMNGAETGTGIAADMLDGPFGAARFLFEHLAARGIAITPGQWISTGAVTGVHPVAIGDRVEARFDGRLSVRCTITAQ